MPFVRSMEGEGAEPQEKVARRIKEGKGVPTFPKVDKDTGLPDYEEFYEVALAIAQWVQVEDEKTGESMQGCLEDPYVEYEDLSLARGTLLDKALSMLIKGPAKLGDLANICEGGGVANDVGHRGVEAPRAAGIGRAPGGSTGVVRGTPPH